MELPHQAKREDKLIPLYIYSSLAKCGVVDQLFVMGSLAVESVVLMKSELKPTGSVHTKLWAVRLRG